MTQLTKEQEARRAEYYAERLRLSGYKVNPPSTPQRQTQSLSESYDYQDDRERPNSWLPQSLQGRDARAWKAAANRRVPWANAMPHGESPDEVLQAMCSLLAYSLLGDREKQMMSPNTEI